MAAALIPLGISLLPTALEFAVRLLGKVLPPKSGPAKSDAATEIGAAIQQALINSKVLTGTPLTGDQLKSSIQSIVDNLNARGELKGAATTIDVAAPSANAALADLMIYVGNAMKGTR